MGYIRLLLSLLVMAAHLAGFRPDLASWCVWLFYLLSGFLAELAMTTKYTGRSFFVGRLYRIFPVFWVSALLTLFTFNVWGNPDVFPLISYPLQREWVLLNIQHWWGGFFGPRLMPHAWALTVMLFWWAVMALGGYRGRRLWFWTGAGIAATIAGAYPMSIQWFSLWGGMLPFAVGAWLYRNGLELPADNGLAMMGGAFSYPLYCCHYAVAIPVAHLLGLGIGWPLFFAALAPTLALSWLLVVAVERPVQKFRSSLKKTMPPTP